ncbi:MAG: c-type cytochrome domain-containing protein, partial [Flavobacteriaceae bacterium]
MTFWLDFLGKFHPVVLHLPIGALVFTGVLVLLALQDKARFERAIRVGLIFSFFGALLSSMLGYLLYQSGGYEADAVQPHLILGWASTAGIGGLWYLFGRVAFRHRFVPLFVLVFLAIGFTGHYGGMLTHGEGYLTGGKLSLGELYHTLREPEEQAVMVKRDSIQLYTQVVAKIFDKKCVSCHNFSKRKGGLALHLPEAILEGGERGLPYDLSIIAESRILAYAQLPLEDDLHMPPQGRPQLSPTELNLLTHWIATGAKFDTTLAYQSMPEPVQEAVNVFFPQRLPTADPLSAKAIKALQEKGFRVSSYIADSPFVQVKFEGEQLDRSAVNSLLDVAEQLVELDLAQT